MNPKITPCLALVLLSLVAYGLGPPDVYEISRTNLNINYSFLLIKSKHDGAGNQDMVVFRVAVMPKDNHHPADFFGGVLTIKNGEKCVATVDVRKARHSPEVYFPTIPKSARAGTVEYDFSVSRQYLSNSDFTLIEDPQQGPYYRFALKDFADEN